MKNERACAVICEYNPFHFGHQYQLNTLRETFGTVVCLLGSELTQRGEVAIADRYARARAALENGADLVLELPMPWCCASARDFAYGGVSLAKAIGVDALAFSAESDGDALRDAAGKRTAAEETIRARIREAGTLSYPAAAEEVLGRTLREHPNDILAIEYISAAREVDLPCHILRREGTFASSSAIRREGVPQGSLPEGVEELLRRDPSFPRKTEEMGKFLLACLRNHPQRGTYGVSKELYARMTALAEETEDFAAFVTLCTNKMFTSARVRRAAWSMAFGFPADLPGKPVPYAMVLASNGRGRAFLRKTEKVRTIPLVSRPAEVREDPVYRLNARVQEVLRLYYGGEPAHTRRPVMTD